MTIVVIHNNNSMREKWIMPSLKQHHLHSEKDLHAIANARHVYSRMDGLLRWVHIVAEDLIVALLLERHSVVDWVVQHHYDVSRCESE